MLLIAAYINQKQLLWKVTNSNRSTASLHCKAAMFASWRILLKFLWPIASLSNMASDKTTEDAPLAIYSPTEPVWIVRNKHLIMSGEYTWANEIWDLFS